MEAISLPRARALALPRRVLATFDDEGLVEHLRRGNMAAFEVIYDRHHRGILAYARHLLGSREEAEDAVQQTFASAYDALVAGEREVSLKAWLYTIARNRCLSVLRARREQPAELDEISTTGLSELVQQRDDLRELLADVRELPEPQRAALVLSEVGGLAHADIAHVLECDVAKVKSLVFQARSGLIERRQARETPCEEIREQLSVLSGGSLRRGPLRRHLKACPGCAAYRQEVKRQRQMLAIVLPVIPTVGMRESVLAAAGIGGGAAAGGGVLAGLGGAAAAGGGATSAGGLGGVAAGLAAKAGLAKVAVAVVAGGAAVGGGTYAVTIDRASDGGQPPTVAPASGQAPESDAPGPAGGPPALVPSFGEQRSDRARERSSPRSQEARERAAERRAERGREQRRRNAGRSRQPGAAAPDAQSRRPATPERRRAKPEPQGQQRGRSEPPPVRPVPPAPRPRPETQTETETDTTPLPLTRPGRDRLAPGGPLSDRAR